MTTLRALILDYGQVLSLSQTPGALAAMAAMTQAGPDAFEAAYWRHRNAYDLGLPVGDYWHRVLADADGQTAPTRMIESLVDLDVGSWTRYRDEVWTLAAAARKRGLRTAILSNGVPEVMERVARERALEGTFDAVVVSYEVACAKPDPAIYTLTLQRLGVGAGESLFVDDRAENIDAARRLGLETLLFDEETGVTSLAGRLA
jgi:putative hydrolase of the HAD superfamily